jgi:hypothetical protein
MEANLDKNENSNNQSKIQEDEVFIISVFV